MGRQVNSLRRKTKCKDSRPVLDSERFMTSPIRMYTSFGGGAESLQGREVGMIGFGRVGRTLVEVLRGFEAVRCFVRNGAVNLCELESDTG
jgi:hypothetical protein